MNAAIRRERIFLCLILALFTFVLALRPSIAAQTDQEPNNSCVQAQNFGALPLPAQINGALGSNETVRDLDFFRIVANPGTLLEIKMQGQGALVEPMLGVFSGDCASLLGRDFQFGQPARLIVTVPADGVVILAASQYPDFDFTFGGVGAYRIDVAQFATVKAIRGRLVDAVTHAPIGTG
ncbi:MAG TPA: hypothetical protein VFA81_06985, partial [Burkholderiales bacterium]|nr:hypothetical protein [Burkholderiales bacterium]